MNYPLLILSLVTYFSLPLTAHAYLVPLLGGAGAVATVVILALIIIFIFGFFIWYHCKKIFKKVRGKSAAIDADITINNKYRNSPSLLAGLIFNHRDFWLYLGNKESSFLAKKLAKIAIKEPIYVMGLARSGTSILLEYLSSSQEVAVQKYRDFPFIFTPYYWLRLLSFFDRFLPEGKKKERSHRDGLLVNSKSPEAMEEPIWRAFFQHVQQDVLDKGDAKQDFEHFYDNHLKKIIAAQNKKRYLSKGNYNISRIGYLHKLYPDAKMVILVRNPLNHIFSLIKQHHLFKSEQNKHPKSLTYMNMLGHFEFGNNFRPIQISKEKSKQIMSLLEKGEEVRAFSIYWAMIYGFVKSILGQENILLVRYEDLCANSEEVFAEILSFTGLDKSLLEKYDLPKIKEPSYYKIDFSHEELEIIKSETNSIAKYFNYDLARS